MKITKKQLKRIIKEEIENLLDDTKQASVDEIQANAAKHGTAVRARVIDTGQAVLLHPDGSWSAAEEAEPSKDDTKQASVDDTQANAAKHGIKAEEIPHNQFPGHGRMSGKSYEKMLLLVQKAVGDTWEISHPGLLGQQRQGDLQRTWDRSKNQIVYLGRMNDHIFFKTSNDHRYFKLQVPDS